MHFSIKCWTGRQSCLAGNKLKTTSKQPPHKAGWEVLFPQLHLHHLRYNMRIQNEKEFFLLKESNIPKDGRNGGVPSVLKAKRILINKKKRWMNVLICSGLKNKILETGWPKQQKFISVMRLEVQDQGGSSVGFRWELSSQLAGGGLFSVCSHSPYHSMHMEMRKEQTLMSKDTNPMRVPHSLDLI